jgi:adenylosuccinate synthase
MANLAIVGAQWGDEGKGKVVDLLAPRFALVARYQGGPNAGHTVAFDRRSFALRHIPSGIFHQHVRSLIGAGTLVDPVAITEEIDNLEAAGIPVAQRLTISDRAHVIFPFHRDLDAALEKHLQAAAIGTTKRGIGPAYSAKVERGSVRLADLADPKQVAATLQRSLDSGLRVRLQHLGCAVPVPADVAREGLAWWQRLGPLSGDVTSILHEALADRLPVLFEGAQGTLLDIDHGTYPFVTSSNTIAGGIPPSLGIPPRAVEHTLGVVKAYCTRVGAGPFPSEELGPLGDEIRTRGREFGTVTGRPRRCGWFDAVAARYAVRLNGLDGFAVTKFDVLTGIDPVRVCVAYEVDGDRTTRFPSSATTLGRAKPIYQDFPGWRGDLSVCRRVEDLPFEARSFIASLESMTDCPVAIVSVGPDREQTIVVESGLMSRFAHSSDVTR